MTVQEFADENSLSTNAVLEFINRDLPEGMTPFDALDDLDEDQLEALGDELATS